MMHNDNQNIVELYSINTDKSLKNSDIHLVSDSHDAQAETFADEQYPHGLKLVLLAGASIVAVFLISLDQVGTWLNPSDTKIISLTQKPLDHYWHGDSQDHGRVSWPQ